MAAWYRQVKGEDKFRVYDISKFGYNSEEMLR